MLIFYVDEFGDNSILTQPGTQPRTLKAGVSDYFILSGVGVRDTSRKPLAEALYEIKERHFGAKVAKGRWSDSEIKGRHLFRASRSVATGHVLKSPNAYKTLTTPAHVDALISDLGMIFAKFRPVIFSAVVDKADMLTRKINDPLGVAYAYLNQRVALTMERVFTGEGAILVADQQTQHETYFRSGHMNALRDQITNSLGLKPDFRLVLDKPLWVDTDLSSWDREIIQLADIAAYSTAECMKRGAPPQESCYLWKQVSACMAINWRSGGLESGGFAIYPKPKKYPQM